jgi:hypothetical protein
MPLNTAAEAPETDPYEGLPEAWSASAKETYVQIEREHPDLDSSSLATLYEACGLFALADALQARVDEDGYVVKGSQGQPTAHPLLSEVRLNRVQAMSSLRALGIARLQSAASAAGAALVAKRWQGRTPGVRAGR